MEVGIPVSGWREDIGKGIVLRVVLIFKFDFTNLWLKQMIFDT